MARRVNDLLGSLARPRRPRFSARIVSFFKKLPPSDRAIITLLALVFVGTCLVGLVALQRTILVEVPVAGGSLTEGIVGHPRFVNPLLALTDADRDMTALTYAGLMGVGPDGVRPVLAESYTISPDGKVYTFTLRPAVTFSDGTPVTAEDVVFTVQKAQDPALKSPELANWANIRVEAVDARTIRFTLPKAYAPFLEDTTLGILPAHLWKGVSNEQFPFNKRMEEPVGAGPFKITRIVRDQEGVITEYELVANTGYALGRPYLDRITMRFFETTEEVANAYRNRRVESAYGIAIDHARTAPYSRVFGVFFNQDNDETLKQLAVRKALSVAVNRVDIVVNTLGAYASPVAGPVPPGSGIEEPVIPEGDTIATAREILMDAGWVFDEEAKLWKNAKLKLSIDGITLTTSNVPELKALASAIQSDWQELGVPVTLEVYDPGNLVASVIRPRKYEALYFGMVIGRDQDLFPFWDSSQKNDPGLNIALYADNSVDRLLEQARAETDTTERLEELQEISDTIAADYPAVFTHSPDFVYALPDRFEGVVLPQITAPADRFANVSEWHTNTHWVWPAFAPKSE